MNEFDSEMKLLAKRMEKANIRKAFTAKQKRRRQLVALAKQATTIEQKVAIFKKIKAEDEAFDAWLLKGLDDAKK